MLRRPDPSPDRQTGRSLEKSCKENDRTFASTSRSSMTHTHGRDEAGMNRHAVRQHRYRRRQRDGLMIVPAAISDAVWTCSSPSWLELRVRLVLVLRVRQRDDASCELGPRSLRICST